MSAHSVIVNLTTELPMDISNIVGEYLKTDECIGCNLQPRYIEHIESVISGIETGHVCYECMSFNYYSEVLLKCKSSDDCDHFCCEGCLIDCKLCKLECCSNCLKNDICSECELISNHLEELNVDLKKGFGIYYNYIWDNMQSDETIDEFINQHPYNTIPKNI